MAMCGTSGKGTAVLKASSLRCDYTMRLIRFETMHLNICGLPAREKSFTCLEPLWRLLSGPRSTWNEPSVRSHRTVRRAAMMPVGLHRLVVPLRAVGRALLPAIVYTSAHTCPIPRSVRVRLSYLPGCPQQGRGRGCMPKALPPFVSGRGSPPGSRVSVRRRGPSIPCNIPSRPSFLPAYARGRGNTDVGRRYRLVAYLSRSVSTANLIEICYQSNSQALLGYKETS